MIIAVRTIFVTVLIHGHILPERLLALLANKCHVVCLSQGMCLGLSMTLGAIVPLLAAGCPN